MVPLKPFFLGEEAPPYKRAVSVQKCVRTIDIDIIGSTHRHLSFFEMMGNFSFGDYFKEQAIAWAYELVTDHLRLDPGPALVHGLRDRRRGPRRSGLTRSEFPASGFRQGDKDNFWQMGVPGPCGPCSELFYDKGTEYGDEGGPIGGGEERYVEIWNLVFMQNIQDEPYHVIGDLPAKNIDTGMGLERMAAVLYRESTRCSTPMRSQAGPGRGRLVLGVRYGDGSNRSTSHCGSWPTTADQSRC